jgi:tripartite-type tricarboxylate transporter receptor subunit TctC
MRHVLILVASMLLAGGAFAQETYPSKALRIITPAAPGTSPDLLSRVSRSTSRPSSANRYSW